ncbi:MAG: 5-oxoprolinase subunit PxpB [Dokdonella sp.]
MQAPIVETPSERVILLRFGDRIGWSCNARVHAAVAVLRNNPVAGMGELIPAYATLAVHYDPAAWVDAIAGRTPSQRFADSLLQHLAVEDDGQDDGGNAARIVEIPVCYDAEFGPDLNEAANELAMTTGELVALHVAGDYRVAMLGFAPGFPYLLGLDPKLQLPRRSQPRLQVAAGSVAIGGAQTGIYPSELPGGWRLIGRTPMRLFDLKRSPPQTLNPGDRVRFVAVDRTRFDALNGNPQ